MDHTSHSPLEATEINEPNLISAAIYGPHYEKFGTVAHGQGIRVYGGYRQSGNKSCMQVRKRLALRGVSDH